MYVYKLNFKNGKSYIGITTKTIIHRFRQHVLAAFSKNTQSPLYRAFRKYRIACIEQIDTADTLKQLKDKERYNIIKYNSIIDTDRGYNMSYGGEINKLSEKTKENLRIKNLGKKQTYETKLKHTIHRGGKPFFILKDNVILEKFELISACAEKFTICENTIRRCLQKKKHHLTSKGFQFIYVHEYENGMLPATPRKGKIFFGEHIETGQLFEGNYTQIRKQFTNYQKILVASKKDKTYKKWFFCTEKEELPEKRKRIVLKGIRIIRS